MYGTCFERISPIPWVQISVIGSKLKNCCKEFIILLSVYDHAAISSNWIIFVLKFREGNFFNELFKTQAAYPRCGIIQNHGVFANYVKQDGRQITRSALNWRVPTFLDHEQHAIVSCFDHCCGGQGEIKSAERGLLESLKTTMTTGDCLLWGRVALVIWPVNICEAGCARVRACVCVGNFTRRCSLIAMRIHSSHSPLQSTLLPPTRRELVRSERGSLTGIDLICISKKVLNP